jgi:hypothetical protein
MVNRRHCPRSWAERRWREDVFELLQEREGEASEPWDEVNRVDELDEEDTAPDELLSPLRARCRRHDRSNGQG